MQLHFFNSTNAPLLREAWMNIHYKDPAEVTTVQASLGHYAGLGFGRRAHAGVRVVRLQEPGVIPLDSAHQNPAPDSSSKVTGGHTGILELKAGDRFEFECEIVNDSSAPLRWANEALTAEMCILRGTYAPSLGRAWSSLTF